MKVLGLETSCDETAAAVVEVDGAAGERPRGRALSDVVHTQAEVHARYGGVVPELASRDHLQRALPVLDEALRRAGCALSGFCGQRRGRLLRSQRLCVAEHWILAPAAVGSLEWKIHRDRLRRGLRLIRSHREVR